MTPSTPDKSSSLQTFSFAEANKQGTATEEDGVVSESFLPSDPAQYGDLVRSIISRTPGRVVVLRGLPTNLTPDTLKRRLRTYALADPAETTIRWHDTTTNAWKSVQVEPVLKMNASSSRYSHAENRDDKNHQVLFLVRMKTTLDAQRLRRRFHRQLWEVRSRSYAMQGGLAKLEELKDYYAEKDARKKMEMGYDERDEDNEEEDDFLDEARMTPRWGSRSSNAPRNQTAREERLQEEETPFPPAEPGEVRMYPPRRVIEVEIMF